MTTSKTGRIKFGRLEPPLLVSVLNAMQPICPVENSTLPKRKTSQPWLGGFGGEAPLSGWILWIYPLLRGFRQVFKEVEIAEDLSWVGSSWLVGTSPRSLSSYPASLQHACPFAPSIPAPGNSPRVTVRGLRSGQKQLVRVAGQEVGESAPRPGGRRDARGRCLESGWIVGIYP